jgi:autotransporter-associated beta strand protein
MGLNATNQNYAAAFNGKIVDSTTGAGGVLGISKIGINVQDLTATGGNAYTYSGDTTVSGGILRLSSLAAVSRNSNFRLHRGDSTLDLNFTGTADVKGLNIDGVQLPNGVYDRNTAPITGSGALRVIGNLETEQSGSELTFSWVSMSKLQFANGKVTGPWLDYPDGDVSPVTVTIDPTKPAVFFRLAPLP